MMELESIPDEVLLQYATDGEWAAYIDANGGSPYHSAAAVFWRFCPNVRRQEILNRIYDEPKMCGQFLVDLILADCSLQVGTR